MARVQELEESLQVADARAKSLEESKAAGDARALDLQAFEDAARQSEEERDQAMARVQELEESLRVMDARAKGLEESLTLIGRSVGAELRKSDLADNEASAFESALKELGDAQQKASLLEQEKQQVIAREENLRGRLEAFQTRLKDYEDASQRAERLAAGVQEIYTRIGADQRKGIFSFFGGSQTDEDMIKDTLAQIDDLKKE